MQGEIQTQIQIQGKNAPLGNNLHSPDTQVHVTHTSIKLLLAREKKAHLLRKRLVQPREVDSWWVSMVQVIMIMMLLSSVHQLLVVTPYKKKNREETYYVQRKVPWTKLLVLQLFT
jgi:hypothetical protein